MNSKVAFIISSILLFNTTIFAQRSNQKGTEERAAYAFEKIVSSLSLEKSKKSSIRTILSNFYSNQEKLKSQLQQPSSQLRQGFRSQNFQYVRKQNEDLINERDAKLKRELTTEQYKKWKGNIEPSLRRSNRRR